MSNEGTRGEIAKALDGKIDPAKIDFLIDEVLASTKKAWAEFSCKKCNARQRQQAEIPDAKAVVSALTELMNQSWGRPTEQRTETEIVVERNVYLVKDDDEDHVELQGE